MFDMLDVTPDCYLDIAHRTRIELSDLCSMIVNGWPDSTSETPLSVREYWDSRDLLSVTDGIVYKGMRIVIPPSLRNHMLKLIHKPHLGIVKCKHRAREDMYWPAMNTAKEVRNCSKCSMHPNKQSREQLKPTSPPEITYGEVGSGDRGVNLSTRTELLKTRNTGPNLNQQMRDIKEKQKFY